MALRKFELDEVDTVQAAVAKSFPIKIAALESLLERIYEQYPLATRTEIVLVVRGFFSVMRKKLLNGETISFASFVNRFHLGVSKKLVSLASDKRESNESVDQIRVCLRTPLRLREEYGRRK